MKAHPAGSDESLSIWIDTTPGTRYPTLNRDVKADVAIVGGGITGITAAYLLADAGASVVLVEKGRIAMSETGYTTAHIVESTDADYRELFRAHREKGARLNTEAIRAAIGQIRLLVEELSIDCGFRAVEGFLYAEEEKDREYLEREHQYLERAGVQTEWTSSVPLPFSTIGGLKFRNQHIFHIRQYLLAVAKAASERGARIFENTQATDVKSAGKRGQTTVRTDRGVVRSEHVLLATHVPLNDRGKL